MLTKRMHKYWIVKKANQPLGHQSAGCIFKNPRGMSAGMLIDQAGLKGSRVGGAEVSDLHANFIVADASATSHDVLRLIDLIRSGASQSGWAWNWKPKSRFGKSRRVVSRPCRSRRSR